MQSIGANKIICTSKHDIGANTKFVNDSATAILAPISALSNPLIGCSPIEVAMPTFKYQVNIKIVLLMILHK